MEENLEEGTSLVKNVNWKYGKKENIMVVETDQMKAQTIKTHPGVLDGGADSKCKCSK